MPKKSRIRQTKQKKSSLQRQKQSQDVKQSVRVVVNLKERRARRRPARKAPNLAPFRGEPLMPSSARVWTDKPPIISGNISDDQRKAIMAEGARQLALEYRQQKINSDQEAAIENDRDVPALKGGGSVASFNTGSGIPKIPPSVMSASQIINPEQDTTGTKTPKALEKKIAGELNKVVRGEISKLRTPSQLRKSGWRDDEIDDLDKRIDEYLARNPVYSRNKTQQQRFKNLLTGEPMMKAPSEDSSGDVSSGSSRITGSDISRISTSSSQGFGTPQRRAYDANPDYSSSSSSSSSSIPSSPFRPPVPQSFNRGNPFINPFPL
jgi:hypothetical protein